MSYYKKILVLKQASDGFSVTARSVSGIAKLESEDNSATLNLSLINLASISGGKYYAFYYDDATFLPFDLGSSVLSKTLELSSVKAESGFAVMLAFSENDNITPVLFGSSLAKITSSYFKEIIKNEFTQKLQKPNKKIDGAPKTNISSESETEYNDETVATENYYLNSDVDIKNLTVKDDEEKPIHSSVDEAKPIIESYGENKKYYLEVKDELENLLSSNPRETSLEDCLPNSKWARVNFSDTKFYVVGLVNENGAPKYICYGVPSTYSRYPPKELAGFCSFMPISLFDLKGDGFWMLYQDAVSGECVRFEY